jgi:hypothetical protein
MGGDEGERIDGSAAAGEHVDRSPTNRVGSPTIVGPNWSRSHPPAKHCFASLLRTVVAFDQQLCAGFSDRELATMRKLLPRLRTNATSTYVAAYADEIAPSRMIGAAPMSSRVGRGLNARQTKSLSAAA